MTAIYLAIDGSDSRTQAQGFRKIDVVNATDEAYAGLIEPFILAAIAKRFGRPCHRFKPSGGSKENWHRRRMTVYRR